MHVDYDAMTKPDLIDLATARGIVVASRWRKDIIIAKLKEAA